MRQKLIHARNKLPLLLVLVLAACGGGSNGGGQNNVPPPAPPPPPPPPQFANIATSSGIDFGVGYSEKVGDNPEVTLFAGGAAAGDYDNDGDIDLFVVRGDVGANLLYRNDGNSVFAEVAGAAGVALTNGGGNYRHSGPVFADMDGDGDLDLFVGGIQGDPSKLFENNGDGTFTDITQGSGIDTLDAEHNISAAFGDYDLDGDLDLLLAHWGTYRDNANPGDTEHLWRNDSAGGQIQFVSVSEAAGISPSIINLPDPRSGQADQDFTFAPSFARIDDDLYPDILMVADFGKSMVFMNNQDGTFTNTTDVDVITDTNGMGSALGDYDNDGDLDWFVTSIWRAERETPPNGNRLYRNDGGNFADVTDEAGVENGGWGWAASFVDFENDGDLDIYHTNGWPVDTDDLFSVDESRAFVSDGQGSFTDQASELGLYDNTDGRGVVCADFDRDGDVDIFLWNRLDASASRLYRNDGNTNNYLTVLLQGVAPNTQAAGARIRAAIGTTTQMREISVASNFVTQNPTDQIFGLGTASQVDALSVEWPDGQVTDLGVVQANQTITVDHPEL